MTGDRIDNVITGMYAQSKPGWEFAPDKFGLPEFPIPAGSISAHKKAAAIHQHLMIGSMLGYVRLHTTPHGTQSWHRMAQRPRTITIRELTAGNNPNRRGMS